MRIACGVVLFNPTPEQLDNVNRLEGFVRLYRVDNSLENRGIAWALNELARQALADGYEWLLTLDQDANLPAGDFNKYVSAFDAYDDKENTAIISPTTEGTPSGIVEDVIITMTSPSLTNLSIWKELGGFADELFIDEVDHEYCLRAKSKGYRIVRLGNVFIPHSPGKWMMIKTVRGYHTEIAWHPPRRLYYMFRNYWYLRKRYSKAFPEFMQNRRIVVLAKVREYVLYHPRKLETVYQMARGTFHGMIGRFGQ